MADVVALIINPTIRSETLSLTRWARPMTRRKTKILPAHAANATLHGLVLMRRRTTEPERLARITMATMRLEPELSPSTSGPAKGFLNNVCIISPPDARAAPARMHVTALGNRKCHRMSVQTESCALPVKVENTTPIGILTLPSEILTRNKRTTAVNRIKMGLRGWFLSITGFEVMDAKTERGKENARLCWAARMLLTG